MVFLFFKENQVDTINLDGYLGGEKIGLFEDEEFHEILKNQYNITIDYSKAGSLDMVRADFTGRNYLFPSSQTALDLYTTVHGKPIKSEIIFNTPIVLYSRELVVNKLVENGLVKEVDGSYYVDMIELVKLIEEGTSWADLGVNELYGPMLVNTTDPTKSNSGNMFAGLVANSLNGGQVVNSTTVSSILPSLKNIFAKLGYMETSSADLFNQFLKTGVGAKPIIAGYESQLLEFAVLNPDDYAQVKDDIKIIYPTPTVWSSHIYIALDEEGKIGIDALMNEEVQNLAWEKHGFRTGVAGVNMDSDIFGVSEIAKNVTRIIPMPDSRTMEIIINSLQ